MLQLSAGHPYSGLNPPEVWRHFAALNGIPRQPGREDAARNYVEKLSISSGAVFETDAYGNCVARLSGGSVSSRAPVAIQAHLDMVCESAPNANINFDSDPIIPVRDGDKVSARGTTLGADNGIGVAVALALLTDPVASARPLELLFTVKEEVGLLGATNLDLSLLHSRRLINLDSEDDAALIIGCAGEQDLTFSVDLPEGSPLGSDWSYLKLCITGLRGGHSGVQIHESRANAIKLLAELLEQAAAAQIDYLLASFDGGSAHNAIPREANATIALPTSSLGDAASTLGLMCDALIEEWCDHEPSIEVFLKEAPSASVAKREASDRLLSLLQALPHGVIDMADQFGETVGTSANLAVVRQKAGKVETILSIRGLVDVDIAKVASRVKTLGAAAGANLLAVAGYPAWEPQPDNDLTSVAVSSYSRVRGRPPTVEVVHGGLECGVLVARCPGLEAVSFGPLIREAHTPQEHVYASTVDATWRVLKGLLDDLDD